MTYRSELIQVAAVAVAAIQTYDLGRTGLNEAGILAEVREERKRQESKWGPQTHAPIKWLAILMEEVGEAAKDALERLPTSSAPSDSEAYVGRYDDDEY
ncbi:MAG: hypothetical protein ACREBU_00570 [Nitrososphaera sp.]